MPQSKLQQATIQSAILNVSSSLIAQLLKAYRSSGSSASASAYNPLGLEFIPILQFLITCLVMTPPNFIFQQHLERRFPGNPGSRNIPKIKIEDEKVSLLALQSMALDDVLTRRRFRTIESMSRIPPSNFSSTRLWGRGPTTLHSSS